MNTKDKAIIDDWDGGTDGEHTLDVIIKPEFEETVRQSPHIDLSDIVTVERLVEQYGGEPEDYELDEMCFDYSCPSFHNETEHESLVEWVADEIGLKVEWIQQVVVHGFE